jgi:hypothetical protein
LLLESSRGSRAADGWRLNTLLCGIRWRAPPQRPRRASPGSQASSVAFAKSTQARHPLFPASAGTLTTQQTSHHVADWSVAPPRFEPDLSTGTGGFATRGPWRLPGPDSHRPAAANLAPGYVMTPPCQSWRLDCWTHVDRGLDRGAVPADLHGIGGRTEAGLRWGRGAGRRPRGRRPN